METPAANAFERERHVNFDDHFGHKVPSKRAPPARMEGTFWRIGLPGTLPPPLKKARERVVAHAHTAEAAP